MSPDRVTSKAQEAAALRLANTKLRLALGAILELAMVTVSDPHQDTAAYRAALRDVCNVAGAALKS